MKNSSWYCWFSKFVSHLTGKPFTFIAAVVLIVGWGVTGPLFHYSDTWQLIINTSTTIITFLMVFIIQSTQNRDTAALQIKIDELIRTNKEAKDILLDLEEIEEKDLEQIRQEYLKIAQAARAASDRSEKELVGAQS
ncbi:MAG: low affinity iron permease family protein [Rhodanobacteraceae bacterium]